MPKVPHGDGSAQQPTAPEFARLLRRRRLEAGLSQEALAKRAGISTDAISRYERGQPHAPRHDTMALLIDALALQGDARIEFESAADRKRAPASTQSSEARHNLPWQPTSFVGRQVEVAEISGLLAQRRIVTVTGAGGIGKTRTSLEVAALLQHAREREIWFVDLTPTTDSDSIVRKIASILGLQLPAHDDLTTGLISAIRTSDLLLILDNCEHLVAPVRSIVQAILQTCTQITMLATSRERLGVPGEVAYPLSTLALPSQALTTTAEAKAYAALELFTERAAAAKYNFKMSDDTVETAADICRRLDGVALAIELAAARLPLLGLTELRSQLLMTFGAIGEDRHAPTRHRTLYATISWSYDLLDEHERTLFRRLAVFANGWTLEAAEAVAADDLLEKSAVMGALFSLTEKSLVVMNLETDSPRYSFFESTRAYALERLTESGERSALSRRHAQFFAIVAERVREQFQIQMRHFREHTLLLELDNALTALDWALSTEGDAVLLAKIASGFRGYWRTAGLGIVGQRYLTAALDRIDARLHPALMAHLLLAHHPFLHGPPRADALKQAIALLEATDDKTSLARCYSGLCQALAQIGAYSDAEEANDRAAELIRDLRLQQTELYAGILSNRSLLCRRQGRLNEAKVAIDESFALANNAGDSVSMSHCQFMLAEVEFALGNPDRAITLGEGALVTARHIREHSQEITVLCNLACYHLAVNQIEAAESSAREALTLLRASSPDASFAHIAIQHLATAASLRRQSDRAGRLLGYLNAWYDRVGYHRDATDQKSYDLLSHSLAQQLSSTEIATLGARGAHLTEADAMELALRFDSVVGL